MDTPQPDSHIIEHTVQDLGGNVQVLADQLSRPPNVPALEGNAAPVRELQTIVTHLGRIDQAVGQLGQTVGQLGQTVGQLGQTVNQLCQTVNQLCQTVNQLGQTVGRLGQAVNQLDRTVHDGFERLERKLVVADKNNVQRLLNSTLTQSTMELAPLYHPTTGELIKNFPETIKDVTDLRSPQLVQLLEDLGLETTGRLSAQRKRFRRAIGLVIDTA